MITGAICMSHSPLMDRNRAQPDAEVRFQKAIREAAGTYRAMAPDLILTFYPDHMNGFQYNILPPFCIGAQAKALGDYGSVPGAVTVNGDAALELTHAVLAQDVDVALSYDMLVDHGATQPLELLAGVTGDLAPIIPIFINCAASPRPSFRRARELGEAVGRWAATRPERILIIGSGGLSHDPPLPNIALATPEQKERMISGTAASFADRLARQSAVFRAGENFPSGKTSLRPLNPEWDMQVMTALAAGDVGIGDDWQDEAIIQAAGGGANEVRCWIAAMAALASSGPYQIASQYYEPIEEWITGMGVISAVPNPAA